MALLTDAQKARHSIWQFKTMTDALSIRGYYRPFGKTGQALENCLKSLSPEIYGSMDDPRMVELKGLEYVIDRLPRGIEECCRIVLTEEDPFESSPFEKIEPFKRRRTSYRISQKEICFVISRGLSEIYDILTHLTFLYSEAKKIHQHMRDESGGKTVEWRQFEEDLKTAESIQGAALDRALWNLSLILGRTFQETRDTYTYLEQNRQTHNSNNGLFVLIHQLGERIEQERTSKDSQIVIHLTPALMNIIGHQKYGKKWAEDLKTRLLDLGLLDCPVHIISANLHSVVNTIYGSAALRNDPEFIENGDLYDCFDRMRGRRDEILGYAVQNGLHELADQSGTHIGCQIIDTAGLSDVVFNAALGLTPPPENADRSVIVVMDYAFGAQAFELMENLLKAYSYGNTTRYLDVRSISVMGKAGILTGSKGDIILATAHVFEGTSDNYRFENDLGAEDCSAKVDVYTGPMVTVLGTSLQNRDMLEKFQSDWKTVGLEMEGGHYQRAISAAVIKGNIAPEVKLRYAYYASDNPLKTGHTLAAGGLMREGVKPTYMITSIILKKIFDQIAAGGPPLV